MIYQLTDLLELAVRQRGRQVALGSLKFKLAHISDLIPSDLRRDSHWAWRSAEVGSLPRVWRDAGPYSKLTLALTGLGQLLTFRCASELRLFGMIVGNSCLPLVPTRALRPHRGLRRRCFCLPGSMMTILLLVIDAIAVYMTLVAEQVPCPLTTCLDTVSVSTLRTSRMGAGSLDLT